MAVRVCILFSPTMKDPEIRIDVMNALLDTLRWWLPEWAKIEWIEPVE